MKEVRSLYFKTDTSEQEIVVGVNGVTSLTIEPHDGVGVGYHYWYTEQGIEREGSGHYCGDVWSVEEKEVYPSFKAVTGHEAIPGRDYDPDAPMCQDDYEFYTGTGPYSNDVFVIYSQAETERDIEGMPCFWSNESGWGHLAEASDYINKEGYNLPLPDGEWMEYSKARELVQAWVKEN